MLARPTGLERADEIYIQLPIEGAGEWFGARLDDLVVDSRLVVPWEVVAELDPSSNQLDRWVHDQKACHRATDDLWDLAHEVADKYPDLVNYAKKGSGDPFVIAAAITEKAARAATFFPCDVVVVAMEATHLPGKVAIPDAWAREGVSCVDINGWFTMEGWGV